MKITVKRIMLWSLSILVLLTIVLVVHIYIVTRHKTNGEVMRQLSRIDFKQSIDSTEATRIKSFVSHMQGVQSTYFNLQDGILVYTYAVGTQTSTNVYDKLIAFGHYNAERYVVDASAVKAGCPVMDTNSLSGKVTAVVTQLLN